MEAGHLFGPFEGEVIAHVEAGDSNEPNGMDHRYVWEVLDDVTDEVSLWMRVSSSRKYFGRERNLM